MGYERRGSEVWWVPEGMKLEGGYELPAAQIGPFNSLPKRQTGDPIPKIAMDKLIASTIKEGVITEHWIIDYPTITQADHKDTTEPHE